MWQSRVPAITVTVAIGLSQAQLATANPRDDKLIVYDGIDAVAVRAALADAIRLLPRAPARVAVIDADHARPDVRPTLLLVDAFVRRDSPVVYVVRQSPLLQGAIDGLSGRQLALAAVIWHEMAHVSGADERQARRKEEALWMSFIRDQRIDPVAGLRYLRSLVERPADLDLASR